MRIIFGTVLLAGMAMTWPGTPALAGTVYVAGGLGFASDEIDASTTGVNHPTRCDRLLYANPADAPTDAACTDNTPRPLLLEAFDLGGALAVPVSLGYAWDRWRIEAEFFGQAHDGDTRPAIADASNPALLGKASEWSASSPPVYRISDFRVRRLFVNALYTFGAGTRWRPYIGVGAGFARVQTAYSGSYVRSTVADGYIEAVGGDPMQPEEWQVAAAGTLSLLDTEVHDNVFGYQMIAGIERELREGTFAYVSLRWSALGDAGASDTWATVRSHAPVQADGVTPFRTKQALDDIGGWITMIGLRYSF